MTPRSVSDPLGIFRVVFTFTYPGQIAGSATDHCSSILSLSSDVICDVKSRLSMLRVTFFSQNEKLTNVSSVTELFSLVGFRPGRRPR